MVMKRERAYSNWHEAKHNRESKRRAAAKRAKLARRIAKTERRYIKDVGSF